MSSQSPSPFTAVPARSAAADHRSGTWSLARPAGLALPAIVAAALTPAPWVTLLLIAPVVEELVFRSGLQEALLRRLNVRHADGVDAANVLTALAFAAAHVALRPGILACLTALPALLIGRVYQRGRRVAPCIVLHALFNATWLLWVGVSA